jgi:prepilin-type N-terminal cleavage/methylation domain-containing protein
MNDPVSLASRTSRTRRAAMTLTELLCVVAILSILAALYLTVICRAYVRIKKFLGDF